MTTTTQIPSFKTQKYDRQLRFVSINDPFPFFFFLNGMNFQGKKNMYVFHLYKPF